MAKWRDVKHNKIEVKKPSTKQAYPTSCASLLNRVKAFLTDSFLITTPITYLVMYIIFGSGDEFSENRSLGWGLIIVTSAFIIIFFWYVKNQTPGMKAYGLKIINSKEKKISFIQAFIRYFATLFAMVFFILLFIPFFNKDKKTFQDFVSRTIIVNT